MQGEMWQVVSKALQMFSLLLANPKEVSDQATVAWVQVVEAAGLLPAEVEAAAMRILATEQFFPTPGVLIAAARPTEDVECATERAWQSVLECVRRYGYYASLCAGDFDGDEAALWAVSRVGWERLCENLDDDNRAFFRTEFVRTYQLARKDGKRIGYLAGVHERANCSKAYDLTPAIAGRPDWKEFPGARLALPAPALMAESSGDVQA